MTLMDYTRSLNVLNFDCGIGRMCLAGQLCHPVRGRDWVVLSAVQEFNFYINSMYEAIATAMEMIQGTSAAMVADFLSEGDEKKRLMELAIGLTSLSGIIILGFTAALVVPILSAVLVASWNYFILGATALGTGIQTAWLWLTTASAESAVAAAETTEVATSTAATTASKEAAEATEVSALKGEQAALTGGSKLQKRSPKHHHTITHDRYQMWSSLNTYLQQMQDRLQAIISVTANLAIYSPISSQEGLYGALQNGTFLSDHPPKATLVDSARETVQLGTLAQLFRTMNIIFVIDSNPCKQEGPTTPLKHPEAVHFCNSDGVKTSLGMVKTKKIDYEIRNGRLLFSKYGFSTELLYQLAADCQTQRKNLNLTATNGLLTMANNGSDFLQNMIKNGSNLENSMNTFNLTSPGENGVPINPINQDPKSSTILLPDGTSICSFPIPICDLRSPEIKSHISAGDSPAKACQQSLGLPDVDF